MVYLDNAATTPMLPEVVSLMSQVMERNFGNPSSTHQHGRAAKALLEKARKDIASCFGVSSQEIVFTSGGTEGNNLVLTSAVVDLGVTHIITSRIEHHAVLEVVAKLQSQYCVKVSYVDLDEKANIDLEHLRWLLSGSDSTTLVSLMLVNNELGNILPFEKVSELCKTYDAFFHTDAVQFVGHYPINLHEIPVDFFTASAHKFHGPKGVGFAFVRSSVAIRAILVGGQQERSRRAGTENLPAVVAMAKALELSYATLDDDKLYQLELKRYFISCLQEMFPQVFFNGASGDLHNSSYTIVNVRFPFLEKMLLFEFDLSGISVSQGSACQSGAVTVSHVLRELFPELSLTTSSVRFSFSKLTTKNELDLVLRFLSKYSK